VDSGDYLDYSLAVFAVSAGRHPLRGVKLVDAARPQTVLYHSESEICHVMVWDHFSEDVEWADPDDDDEGDKYESSPEDASRIARGVDGEVSPSAEGNKNMLSPREDCGPTASAPMDMETSFSAANREEGRIEGEYAWPPVPPGQEIEGGSAGGSSSGSGSGESQEEDNPGGQDVDLPESDSQMKPEMLEVMNMDVVGEEGEEPDNHEQVQEESSSAEEQRSRELNFEEEDEDDVEGGEEEGEEGGGGEEDEINSAPQRKMSETDGDGEDD
jgi:hypothetical protein